jgi:hypothetical protein
MKLQYLALYKMSKTLEYPRDNQVIDNLIFEIEQVKDTMDVNEFLQDDEPDLDDYHQITYDIYETLFRVFDYTTTIKTIEHVHWKEYFHCLYEHCVIDYDSEQFFHFILKSFDLFEPPVDLAPADPCYDIVNTLTALFDKLKTEHIQISKQLLTPSDYMKYRIERGTKHFNMIRQRAVMESILNWSRQ